MYLGIFRLKKESFDLVGGDSSSYSPFGVELFGVDGVNYLGLVLGGRTGEDVK